MPSLQRRLIPPITRPCTSCGGPGPFYRDRDHWSSRCIACRQAILATNRHRYVARHSAYTRRWQRARRLRQAQLLYAVAPTRQLNNFLGRTALMPGQRWCAYGGHARRLEDFHRVRTNPQGRAYVCKACRKLQQALWRAQRKTRKEKKEANG